MLGKTPVGEMSVAPLALDLNGAHDEAAEVCRWGERKKGKALQVPLVNASTLVHTPDIKETHSSSKFIIRSPVLQFSLYSKHTYTHFIHSLP